jgi:hypothetical protein
MPRRLSANALEIRVESPGGIARDSITKVATLPVLGCESHSTTSPKCLRKTLCIFTITSAMAGFLKRMHERCGATLVGDHGKKDRGR